VRATLAPEEDIFTEQKKILKKTRGGPFEAVAELELARRHLSRGQAEPALAAYWAFWSTVDNLPVRQCQNHAWLAGLRMVRGDEEQARQHLRQSVQYLKSDGVGAAGAILKREFVNQMEQMFPQVAAQAEVQALRQELEEG
jgi:ATP/maltotriose-dependent transcriptional regulator MalT